MTGALPIRARLALWYAGVFALFMGTFALGGYVFVRRGAVSALDETLTEGATAVAEAIALVIAQGHTVDEAVPVVLDQVHFRDLTIAVLDRQQGMLVAPPEDSTEVAGRQHARLRDRRTGGSVHVADTVLAAALARVGPRRPMYVTVEGERSPVRVLALPRESADDRS